MSGATRTSALAFLLATSAGYLVGACSDDSFGCESDSACGTDGTCENTGYCSFPDGNCRLGRRYGDHAGPYSGECVDPPVTTSTGDVDPSTTSGVPGETSADGSTSVGVASTSGSSSTTDPTGVDASTSSTTDSPDCVPPPAGIVAWWRGEDDTSDAVRGYDALESPTLGYGPGMVGQAMEFDGATNARVVNNAELLPEADFSIEAWVRVAALAEGLHATIVSSYECGGDCMVPNSNSDVHFYLPDNGVPYFSMRDGAGNQQIANAATSLDDGAFHHVAAVRDVGSGRLRLYVDGILENDDPLVPTGPLVDMDSDVDPFLIGARTVADATTLVSFFEGSIDELALYHSALTDADVAALFAAGADGKCTQ